MKTFILNIPNEIKNWSNTLDAKSILTSRSWIVFNDDDVKEVYIFQNDGSLIASHNGKVTKAKWEFIAINSSIMIEIPDGDTYLLKPTYYDEKVLALQVDGTDRLFLMVDEKCVKQLAIESFERMKMYLTDKDAFFEEERKKERKLQEKRKQDDELQMKKQQAWEGYIKAKVEEQKKTPEMSNKIKRSKALTRFASFVILSVIAVCILCMIAPIGQGLRYLLSCVVVVLTVSLIVIASNDTIIEIESEIESEMKKIYPFEKFEYKENP